MNLLVVLYTICFSNMGIAIIVFTVIVRLVTLPLTIKQLRQMRAMMDLQPRMREIQERYGRDRQRVSQETMRMYREAGVSPVGCLGPLVIQMPILFGLFRVLIQTLYSRPDNLVALAEKWYAWIPFFPIYTAAPLSASFLWMDLSEPDPTNVIMPVLVFVSTWLQQKMTMTPFHGSPAVDQPDDDALVDAADDRILLLHSSQWAITVLDSVERHRHRHTVFHNRMAANIPAVPEG